MTEGLPEYRLYAIRYSTRPGKRRDHFMHGDPHDADMPMDYFTWVAIGEKHTVVVDIGFTEEMAKKRKRTFLRCPVDALRLLGVEPDDVEDVVITHLHYDHAGNFPLFPKAKFHIQEPEVHFATGKYMRFPRMSHSFEPDDICQVVRLNFAQRVVFYDGPGQVAPGIEVIQAGGHSAGLQFVRVNTKRGWVVLASDTSHFYENLFRRRPFPTSFHVGQMLEGFEKLIELAPSDHHIIPGHDPLVMEFYPAASPELEGIAVALHEEPKPLTEAAFGPAATH